MTPQTFSLEMSRHLSSIVSGFEKHWWWTQRDDKYSVQCFDVIKYGLQDAYYRQSENIGWKKICPAWQVEDVLRNLREITAKIKYKSGDQGDFNLLIFSEYIVTKLIYTSDHYQKIEEYLWSILK